MVDDQAVQDRAEIVAKPALALVSAGELAGEQLGPEFLEDLVGEVLVPDFEMDVSCDGVVILADQIFHRRLALGPGVWALLMVVQLVGISVRRSSVIAMIRRRRGSPRR